MDKQELLSQKLYYLTIDEQNPFMMNNEFVLLYSDASKADATKAKFTERFARQIDKAEISDNVEFIKKMLSFGFEKFVFNGDSSVYKFSDFHDGTEVIRHIQNMSGPAPVNNFTVKPAIQPKPKDNNALVSMICGIASFVFPIPFVSVVAVVFGILSMKNSKRIGIKSDGRAVAGTVLGAINIGWTLIGIGFAIILAIKGSL